MIFLVCESSTLLGSVAVYRDEELLAYRESVRQGSHTNVINHYVDEVLKDLTKFSPQILRLKTLCRFSRMEI